MVTHSVEVLDRFEETRPAREYVYSPVPEDCEIRETRVYEIDGSNDRDRLSEFVEDVLVDDVSQEWSDAGSHDALESENFDTVIDVTLKDDVLDLEEEYLVDYCENHLDDADLAVDDVTIVTRYYLRTNGAGDDVIDTIVRDLVNPVIHEWSVNES